MNEKLKRKTLPVTCMDRKFFAGAGILILSIIVVAVVSLDGSFEGYGTEKAAIIPLNGAITASAGGSFQSQGMTPGALRELNDRAIDQGASAVIYEINSGGGAVVASKEMRREIESVEVPTVCRFRDVAASGAYLASLGCDRIVADTASLTGSIGVRSSYMEYAGLMEKLGIGYVNITSGKLKDLGSPYQNTTEREKQILQEKADIIHEDFISSVKNGRNLTEVEVEEVSTGEIFLGSEAKELGLVDTLGGRETAVEVGENLTDSDLETFELQSRDPGLFSLLSVESWFSGSSSVPLKAEIG